MFGNNYQVDRFKKSNSDFWLQDNKTESIKQIILWLNYHFSENQSTTSAFIEFDCSLWQNGIAFWSIPSQIFSGWINLAVKLINFETIEQQINWLGVEYKILAAKECWLSSNELIFYDDDLFPL